MYQSVTIISIGQSAAKPVREGSETRHGISVTDNAVDKGIVQTTTKGYGNIE